MTDRVTNVRLDEDLLAQVRVAAKRAGTSEEAVIAEAVRRSLAGDAAARFWDPNHFDEEEAMAIHASELGTLSNIRHAG
jgi:hypothetical protein